MTYSIPQILLMAALALPLAGSLAALVPAWGGIIFRLVFLATLPALLLLMVSYATGAAANDAAGIAFPGLLLGATFALTESTIPWMFFTAPLWFSAAWFGRYYLAHDPQRGRYAFFFLGAMAGNFGLILAGDPVSFFTCFALMSFMSYGLVVHDGKPASMLAGKVYLGMAVLGEIFQFAGLSLTLFPMIGKTAAMNFQSLELFSAGNDWVAGLFIAGFGIKAGLLGLHVWLPMAHPVAPTPASAVLSGAMIKAGLIGWINLLPLGLVAMPVTANILVALGLAGAIGAALAGVTQSHPKAVLAYSSVSQMGLMITATGIALGAPQAWDALYPVVMIYATHHAFAKCLLFLSVGLKTVRPLAGWEKNLFWSGSIFAALALIGAPMTSGALAKALLKDAVIHSGWANAEMLVAVLTFAAAGTTLLMIRYVVTLRRFPFDDHHAAPVAIWAPWILLLIGVFAGTLFAALRIVDPMYLGSLHPGSWLKNLWPLALGVLLYAGGSGMGRILKGRNLEIAPGDCYVAYAALGRGAAVVLRWLFSHAPEQPRGITRVMRDGSEPIVRALAVAESSLTLWRIGSVLAVLTSAGIFWLALFTGD